MWRIVIVGLSLSIGWGIRGNFGHEYGAMVPGALASLAALVLCGRSDWNERAPYFAFFGALGWSFGGSISYMQVIAYTHSGHGGSVLYGFACLFVIGFLWAAMGGAGAALPAFVTSERLREFFIALTAVFIAWLLQDFIVAMLVHEDPAFRQNSPLYWYDTDWLAALGAIIAVLLVALVRRRVDFASSLILHMALGWWIAFLLLVNVLGLRMTPPRGDNWAGCLGMVGGMWLFFYRQGLTGVSFASLVAGLVGGFGFAGAEALKLAGIATGLDTNWHSLLEQAYGFINGIGLAIAMFWLARRLPTVPEESNRRDWTRIYATGFVLLVIPFLNLSKNPEQWVKTKAVPRFLYGLPAQAWFDLAFLLLGIAFLILVAARRRLAMPLFSLNPLAKAQLLYLIVLWCMVIGNFERALTSFAAVRLVTEGVIFLNAVVCTVGILLVQEVPSVTVTTEPSWRVLFTRTIIIGSIAGIVAIAADWALVRALYGDRPAAYAAKHIRFGPNATATKQKPAANAPHP